MVPRQGDHPLHQPAVQGVGEDGRYYPGGVSLGHTMEIEAMFIYHFLLPFYSLSRAARKDFRYKEPLIGNQGLRKIHLSRGLGSGFF
jgi:hypothetical protein